MERAAALMEKHDYVRYSEQVARNYVNPNLGSTPVMDLEREVVWFKLAAQYLWDWQKTGKNRERAVMYARKLMGVANPHTATKFLVARVQELEGGSYNRFYVPVPEGMGVWDFTVGQSLNRPTEVSFGSFQNEYEQILNEKKGGGLGRASQAGCAAVLLCLFAINSDDALVIDDLKFGIYLNVTDKQGNPVKIGVSSWLAKSP